MKAVAAAILLALLVVPGCGGDGDTAAEPRLPRPLAAELAQQSDVVAEKLEANDPCGARAEAAALQQRAISAVNQGRVPPRYQEELTAAVNALVVSIACVPAETDQPPVEEDDDEDNDKDEGDDGEDDDGKGNGKGKDGANGNGDRKGKGRRR